MKQVAYFHPALRILHWFMAAAIVAMLFIGIAMVSTISSKHALLVAIHKPLGLMILALAPVNFLLLNRRAKQPRALYCAHCGAPFRAGDQFCTRCGEKRPQ